MTDRLAQLQHLAAEQAPSADDAGHADHVQVPAADEPRQAGGETKPFMAEFFEQVAPWLCCCCCLAALACRVVC